MTPEERRVLDSVRRHASQALAMINEMLDDEQADRDREVERLEYGLFRQRARRADHRHPPLPEGWRS